MARTPTYEEFEHRGKDAGEKAAECRRAEEALRESQEQLKILAEQSLLSIVIIQDDRIVYVNQAYSELIGCPLEEILEWKTEDTLRFVHPDYLEFVINQGGKMMRGEVDGTVTNYQYKGIRNNGEEGWVDQCSKTILYNGKLANMISMIDITDRKRTEEALRQSEERFKFLAENMADIVWTLDLDFKTTYVSPSIKKVLGFTPEERKLQTLEEMVTPESLQRLRANFLEELQRDGEQDVDPERYVTIEIEYYHAAGYTVWMENSMKALRDKVGTLVGMYGSSRDITQRRKAEEELRESEMKFRSLFDFSPQPIALTEERSGRFLNVNDALCEVTQFRREEILGKTTTEFGFYTIEDRNRFLKEPRELEHVYGLEMAFRRKDGSILNTLMYATRIVIGGEGLILSTYVDITARRQAEEEKAKLESQIRQSQKMEAIGTLAGGIAHDFNNILAAIIGFAELTVLDAEHGTPLHNNLEEILQAGIRARELVRQILTFSRQTGQERIPLEFHLIVKEALNFVRASLPATIEIRQNMQAQSVLVEADPIEFHQILMNLCANAEYSMRDRGGILEVSLTEEDVGATSGALYPELTPGSYVKLTVSDTGHGMDTAIKERIFDPFFTTKAPGEGTGMGLSVVHGIVKRYGGTIRVDSKPGKGSSFELLFPTFRGEAPVESQSRKPVLNGDARVLFIDDEQALVHLHRQMLERLGCQVVACTSSREALEIFRRRPDRFDVVITDMSMPQMSGVDLAQALLQVRPNIPIILCTGFSESINSQKTKGIGIQEMLMKPVLANDLVAAIRRVLHREEEDRSGSLSQL